jgi:hypothetical protein
VDIGLITAPTGRAAAATIDLSSDPLVVWASGRGKTTLSKPAAGARALAQQLRMFAFDLGVAGWGP